MRAVIFANGDFNRPTNSRADLRPEDYLMAADGGTHHCLALGFTPRIVIGDLDSITNELLESLSNQGAEFILYPKDKDETDLELALRHAVEHGAQEILLLAIAGGRLDQTLANLLLMTRLDWQGVRITAADGPDFATLLREDDSLAIDAQSGDTVSLIPLTPKATGVSTQGLRWSLQDATLEFGSTLGISNEAIEERVRVGIKTGQLLVVHRIGEVRLMEGEKNR